MFGVALAAVFLGGLAFLAWKDSQADNREIWLVSGARYAIAVRLSPSNTPGFDYSMFPGFCEFTEAVTTTARNSGIAEFHFTAQWCAANTLWVVPEGIAIARL